MIQAGLYPNPTVGYTTAPNANNTGSTTIGFYYDQVVKTGGKLKLQTAVGFMNLIAAELALKRARYNLATTIRTDYYNLLVAKEMVRVNRGLVRFTDEIYRLQADLFAGGFAATHEPAALRSQAFAIRLAYRQSILNYTYAWKQLVADLGLKQLPLSQVEGQVDRLIPNYDYDAVRASVLSRHTDILTARANLEAARYGLKLARVTPVPDVEVNAGVWKEHQIQPFQNYYQVTVSIPLAVFDRNQGGIRAANAGLVRASEAEHAAEVALTTGLASAYSSYKANLAAVEYYRGHILPDQVRYYRGVFERRRVDPTAAFGDLVQAQQVLVSDVTAYLGVLQSLWTSVVNVADYLQTDDLYQLGGTLELPHLPDLDALHPLPCTHPGAGNPSIGKRPDPPPNAVATPPPSSMMSLDPDPSGTKATGIGSASPPPSTAEPVRPTDGLARKTSAPGRPVGTLRDAEAPSIEQPSESPLTDLSQRHSAASH
jgi:cobalt-zinc-cadmium efflux system outer membrane protein